MNESQWTSRVLKPYLTKEYGARVFKIHADEMQEKGIPDVIAVIDGFFYGFEIKKKGNEPTPVQCAVMRSIRRAGGKAGVVYTHSYKRDIQDILNGAYDHLV